jgi:hypothetical protein
MDGARAAPFIKNRDAVSDKIFMVGAIIPTVNRLYIIGKQGRG